MNITIESISSVKKKIQVQLNHEQYDAHVNSAYKDLQKNVSIPGFRKGKTPKTLLQKKFGKDILKEVHQEIQKEGIRKALEEHKIEAVNITDVTEVKEETGKGFGFTASLETHPIIELKDYIGISVKKNTEDVKEESISDVLKRFQDMHAVMKPLDVSKPKKGHYASVVVQSLDDDGQLIPSGRSDENPDTLPEEQLHQMGHEAAIKEIDQAIAKLSVGETSDVKVTEDKEKNIPNLHLRITLKSIKEKNLPELDDDFAKTMGPYQSLDELKAKVKVDLTFELDQQKNIDYAINVLDQIRDMHPIELPETLMADEMTSIKTEFFNRTVARGQNLPEDFTVENLEKELKPDAEKRVHDFILIKAIAKKEGIEVTPQEFETKIHELSRAYNKPPKELISELSKNHRLGKVQDDILFQKTLDFLVGKANIS